MPTVLGSYGLVTQLVFLLGMDGMALVVLEKCPAVVPCATTDEESGSSLKLGSCVGQHYVFLGTRKTCFEKTFSFK